MPEGPDVPLPFRALLATISVIGALVLILAFAVSRSRNLPVGEHRVAAPSAMSPASATPSSSAPAATTHETSELAKTPAPAASATPGSTPAALAGSPPGTAGMLVGIDPETGRPGRPSKAFRDKLEALRAPGLDRSSDGLTVVTRPDGSKHVNLQGRFQEYMVVRLTSDGRKAEDCVEGPDVEKALQSDPAPAPALEEK